MLIAVITGPTIEMAIDQVEQVRTLADGVEFRLDYFERRTLDRLEELISVLYLPCIFTLRKQGQGGRCEFPEGERLEWIERFFSLHPDYFDLESDTDPTFIGKIAKQYPKTKLIGSYHNFEKTPFDLIGLFNRMKNPAFSLYKIAVTASSTLDMLRLMIFLREHSSKHSLCCVSLGEFGKPSRILGKALGSVLNYSSLEEDEFLHRYPLKTLHEVFHYPRLNRDTKLFGLIGDPVEQSLGWLFHNAFFFKEEQNAVYIKMRLKKEEVPEFFSLLPRLPFGGLSVTMPLKELVFSIIDQVDPAAIPVGAVNTITVQDDQLIGTNTDGPGALKAIERHLKVRGKRVAILGAGGTARAIAFQAKQLGATVFIFNRTEERAKDLASHLGCTGFSLEEIAKTSYDLLINTIPPDPTGASPIQDEWILSGSFVLDVSYVPKETPILKAAKLRDCHCIYGEEMFVEQALLQQRDWKRRYTAIDL